MRPPAIRVGQGFDVHPLIDDPDRPLTLGGVTFTSDRALSGHSDGDVIAHAVTDALLGAAGLGDIGVLFPDDDETWAGADSVEMLAEATLRVRESGWEPGNVDVSVVTEHPRISGAREAMQRKLSAAVGAPVTVKGKRPEGLGALGRQEGVAAFAVALVHRGDLNGTTGRANGSEGAHDDRGRA